MPEPQLRDGKPLVVCIVGPTATGKSELGVRLAEQLGGEIVSADSMQVYRGMDVGTAKLTPAEMRGIPHHLIDVVDPDESFSVGRWASLARVAITGITGRGKIPFIVGGTGLYIRAVTAGLDFAQEEGSLKLRSDWQEFVAAYGSVALHQELARRDPVTAARLHPNDLRRVIRALEVEELTGKPMSAEYNWNSDKSPYTVLQFGLTGERQWLYGRVNQRVDAMMKCGLLEEVTRLLEKGYHPQNTALQAIGYKELVSYLRGETTEAQAIADVKQATRRLVKRQLSWFRRDPRTVWFDVSRDSLDAVGSQILYEIKSM